MPLDRYRSIIPDWGRFLETVRTPEPTHVRVRTGRADPDEVARRLEGEGFVLERLEAPRGVFRVVAEPYPVANTLEHWLGLFYVQQAVTSLAAPALSPRPGERILDMAAAPGGKTTHLADLMDDRGTLVAGDLSEKRLRALLGNVYRTAHPNVLVLAADGRRLGGEALFDRVLLDAPCSGEGTLRKRGGEPREPSASYLEHAVGLQRGLLRRAVDLLRPGGTLLYVTCTFRPAENEGVVSRILRERGGELEVDPIDLDAPHAPGLTSFEDERFDPGLERAWRVYPHHLDSGGLFMCRLRKRGDAARGRERVESSWEPVPAVFPEEGATEEDREAAVAAAREGERQLRDLYGVDPGAVERVRWMARGDSVWGITADAWAPVLWEEGSRVRVISFGLRCLKHDPRSGLRPTNDLLQWLGDRVGRRVVEPAPGEWRRLLERKPVDPGGLEDGFVVLRLDGRTVGRGLVWNGALRHEIPKAQAARLQAVLRAGSEPDGE